MNILIPIMECGSLDRLAYERFECKSAVMVGNGCEKIITGRRDIKEAGALCNNVISAHFVSSIAQWNVLNVSAISENIILCGRVFKNRSIFDLIFWVDGEMLVLNVSTDIPANYTLGLVYSSNGGIYPEVFYGRISLPRDKVGMEINDGYIRRMKKSKLEVMRELL